MQESELVDPYLTPRALPTRRPYWAFAIIVAVILLAILAAAFIIWAAMPSKLSLERYPRNIEMHRGPAPDRLPTPLEPSPTAPITPQAPINQP